MTLPKFLRTEAVVKPAKPRTPKPGKERPEKAKTIGELRRIDRDTAKQLAQPVKKTHLAPNAAMAALGDAWNAAQAAHLAGTPAPDSPTGALILAHLERVQDQPLQRTSLASRTTEILDAEDGDPAETTLQDEIVQRHRVDIAETRRIVMSLIDELDFATRHEDLFDLLSQAFALVTNNGHPMKNDALRDAYRRLISLPGRVDMALKLGNTLRALVPLERQASGLPDGYVDAATQRQQRENTQTATVIATSFDGIKGRFEQILMRVQKTETPA